MTHICVRYLLSFPFPEKEIADGLPNRPAGHRPERSEQDTKKKHKMITWSGKTEGKRGKWLIRFSI